MVLPINFPHVEGVSHRFIKANGIQFHVAEAGSGEPLVLLHGWPQHWYMWRHQITELSKKYHVICPDLRGFGWSDAPPQGYKKEELTDDIIALLDALKIDKAKLMGHDWGGWVGFLLCLREPKRIEKYLALNIPHPFQKIDSRLLVLWKFWYQALLATPFLGQWVLKEKNNFVGTGLKLNSFQKKWTDEEISIYAKRFNEPDRANATTQLYRTSLVYETLPLLLGKYRSKRLTVPTLVLFGKEDKAVSTKLLRGYEPYSDNMTIEFVEKCAHFIVEECPELVTKRAKEFFS